MVEYNKGQEENTSLDPTGEIMRKTVGHLTRMLHFRRQYDTRRSEMYRQYIGDRKASLYPDGLTPRSNTFVPYPLSNVENITSRVMDAFFSFDPWFEARPRGQADGFAAEKMQMVLKHVMGRSNFMTEFEQYVRNVCIYGHGGFKVDWDFGEDVVTYPEPVYAPDPETGEPLIDEAGQPIVLRYEPKTRRIPKNRPKFEAIDVYDLLIDPDKSIKGHVVERPFRDVKKLVEMGVYDAEGVAIVEKYLANDPDKDNILIRIAELWDEFEGTVTVATFAQDSEALGYKDLRYSFRNASYKTWKRKMYGGPSVLLKHGENPFLHKQISVLDTSYIKLPNHVFGLGQVEVISDLTESLNKFVNMITDNWNMGINRRYAYNTDIDIDQSALNNFNVPGGKVGVQGDPNKAIMELPFFTPPAGDYEIMGVYRNMIELAGGVSDFYAKGVGAPTGNRTATGINQVVNEGNYRFRMFIRNLETDILKPMLEQVASMIQQFVTDEFEVMITDDMPGIPKVPIVRPEELIGSISFDIVAANYGTNKNIRQRNFLALGQVLAESPFTNEYEFMREMLKTFEVRNVHRLLKSPEQVAAEQQAALQQQIEMMIFQAMLEADTQSKIARARAGASTSSGKKQGRPSTNPTAKIPGQGLSSAVREFAQMHGANVPGGSSESS